MYTNFAGSVRDYFKNRLEKEGSLNDVESSILQQAERCVYSYPISCLSMDDLLQVGYSDKDVTKEMMQRLASKLGDDYHEQLYWTSLEILANIHGFELANMAEQIKDEYDGWISDEREVSGVFVIVEYKNDSSHKQEQVFIAFQNCKNEQPDVFHTVKDIDELCTLCDKNNRYGFYIKDWIEFR